MFAYLQEAIDLNVLIWLLPIAFFIHDGEEVLTVQRWVQRNTSKVSAAFQNRLLSREKSITLQFLTAVLVIGVFISFTTVFTVVDFGNHGGLNLLFIGIVVVMLLDGIKHLGNTIILKQYTPGVVMALLAEIPYSAYALYRFHDAGLLELRMLRLVWRWRCRLFCFSYGLDLRLDGY